jgi:hypothetical protein
MTRFVFLALLACACSSKLDAGLAEPDGSELSGDADADTDTDTDTDTDADADADADLSDDDGDGFSEDEGDCDDDDDTVHPDAEEICNSIDDDCDGDVDLQTDHDGDGVLDCEDGCPILVAAGSTGDGSHTDPMGSIQEAIDAVGACTEVEVGDGTYAESINFSGEAVWIYAAGDATIAGDGSGPVVTIAMGEGVDAVLDGFTITGGGGAEGAGIYIDGSDPEIRNNTISENITDDGGTGGGIFIRDSYARIFDNLIQDNEACYGGTEEGCDGGGLFIRGGAPYVDGNTIVDNRAGDGGGIWVARGGLLLSHNQISGNAAVDEDAVDGGQGGGLDVQIGWSAMAIKNNIFSDNYASTHGGGMVVYEPSTDDDGTEHGYPSVTNNVFAFNEVGDTTYGADVCIWLTTEPSFSNNIVLGSGAGSAPAVFLYTTLGDWSYNAVWTDGASYGGATTSMTGMDGNVSANPMFEDVSDNGDWSDDDFHLSTVSPLIDHGDTSVDDADGSASDMGAYGGPGGTW